MTRKKTTILARTDDSSDADQFFDALPEELKILADSLREIILKTGSGITEAIKWGLPVYEKNGMICALRPGKNYMALQFYASGTSLSDPDHLLEGTGKKMRHVKVRTLEDIHVEMFRDWILASVEYCQGVRRDNVEGGRLKVEGRR